MTKSTKWLNRILPPVRREVDVVDACDRIQASQVFCNVMANRRLQGYFANAVAGRTPSKCPRIFVVGIEDIDDDDYQVLCQAIKTIRNQLPEVPVP